jgi:hypothetical protein
MKIVIRKKKGYKREIKGRSSGASCCCSSSNQGVRILHLQERV